MSNFIIKRESRINPHDPKSHPDFKRAEALGEERFSSMKFRSTGDKRDYMRQVSSNPNNVVGLPAFYPPERIFVNLGGEGKVVIPSLPRPVTLSDWRENIRQLTIREMDIWCDCWNGPISHIISSEECYCQWCGAKKAIRIASSFSLPERRVA